MWSWESCKLNVSIIRSSWIVHNCQEQEYCVFQIFLNGSSASFSFVNGVFLAHPDFCQVYYFCNLVPLFCTILLPSLPGKNSVTTCPECKGMCKEWWRRNTDIQRSRVLFVLFVLIALDSCTSRLSVIQWAISRHKVTVMTHHVCSVTAFWWNTQLGFIK